MSSNPITILHIINGEHYSGAERVQDLLACRLEEYGFKILFICIKPVNFTKHCLYIKERIFDFPMKSKIDLSQIFKINHFIKANNIQIIHTHSPRAAMIGKLSSIMSGIPMVHHIHSPSARDSLHYIKNILNDYIERLCLKGIKQIICVSDSLKKYMIQKGIDSTRIVVVPNGVPVSIHHIPEKNQKIEKKHFFTIGMIALFRPRKGLEILLNAMARLINEKKLDLILNAVGPFETSAYENTMKILTKKLNIDHRVRWLGFKQDVDTEFSKMDIFVLPSLFGEGTPMVILEAMAAGVPVLSTQVEGIPEVIRHDIDGFLVPPGDVQQLEKAMESMMLKKDKTSLYRENALKRQAKFYSDISMAEKVSEIYFNILSGENI